MDPPAASADAGSADGGRRTADVGRVAGLGRYSTPTGKRRRLVSTCHCAPSVSAGSPEEPSSVPLEDSEGASVDAVLDPSGTGSSVVADAPVDADVPVVAVSVPKVLVAGPVVVIGGSTRSQAFQFSAGSRSSRWQHPSDWHVYPSGHDGAVCKSQRNWTGRAGASKQAETNRKTAGMNAEARARCMDETLLFFRSGP